MDFICKTAETMGYRPNLAAKSLSFTSRTTDPEPTVFIPFNVASVSLFDPFFFDYFCGITDCLGKVRIPMEIVRFPNSGEERSTVEQLIAERSIAGVLDFHLSQETLRSLLDAGIPVVSSNWREPLKEIPAIIADHLGGYRKAWRHAVSLGHQRIAFFALDGRLSEHYKECQAAAVMEEVAGCLGPLVVTPDIFSAEANQNALLEHCGRYDANTWPTLFFAQNDFIAARLTKALEALEVRVPEQVSIIGFDDSVSAQLCHPTLTTIHKPRIKVGYEMAKLLLNIMQGQKKGPDFIRQVPTSLIVRESTSPAHGSTLPKPTSVSLPL